MILFAIGIVKILLTGYFIWMISRYRSCPSDKVLVIKSNVGTGDRVLRNKGWAIVLPLYQRYFYLSDRLIEVKINLKDSQLEDNSRVHIRATVIIILHDSDKHLLLGADRLNSLTEERLNHLCQDIVMGQIRLTNFTTDFMTMKDKPDWYLNELYKSIGEELPKIGLALINVQVHSIEKQAPRPSVTISPDAKKIIFASEEETMVSPTPFASNTILGAMPSAAKENIEEKSLLKQKGTVYRSIPPSGEGSVRLDNPSNENLTARTDLSEGIPMGAFVKVEESFPDGSIRVSLA